MQMKRKLKCSYFLDKKLHFFMQYILPKLLLCEPTKLDCKAIEHRIIQWFIDSAKMVVADSVSEYNKRMKARESASVISSNEYSGVEFERVTTSYTYFNSDEYEVKVQLVYFAPYVETDLRLVANRICELTQNKFKVELAALNTSLDSIGYDSQEVLLNEDFMFKYVSYLDINTLHYNLKLIKSKKLLALLIANLILWLYMLARYYAKTNSRITATVLPSRAIKYSATEGREIKQFYASIQIGKLRSQAVIKQSADELLRQLAFFMLLNRVYKFMYYSNSRLQTNKSELKLPIVVSFGFIVKQNRAIF